MQSHVSEVATRRARLLIAGEWTSGDETFHVFDKFSGETIGEADRASKEQVGAAVTAARHSFEQTRLDPYDRYRILHRVSELIEKHRDDWFRHIFLGFGSGDLSVRTAGADRNEILMPNIALIGFKIDPIQQLIRQRQIDTTAPHKVHQP